MFTHYYTEGVVLAKKPIRECDEIITIYTRDFGKVDVIGRAIRKNGSKLRMNVSLFSHVKIGFIQGKSYNTLIDASTVSNFKDARKKLGKLSLFYRISEITLSFVCGQEKDENIFFLLLGSFQKIDKFVLSRDGLKLFFCFFSFNLLYFLGYKLYTEKCVLCTHNMDVDGYFSPKEGGIVCKKCFSRDFFDKDAIYLENVNILRNFLNLEEQKEINGDAKFFAKILDNYLEFIPKK